VLSAKYQGKPLTLEDIDELAINNISLEYRFSESRSTFYPYFRCIGIGSMQGEQITEMTVLLPATETNE
jgi:hypothetical protein